RDNAICTGLYDTIKAWQESASKALVSYLVGIDFCFAEEGHPPSAKQEFMTRLTADNDSNPTHALAVLYHVGESFAQMSLMSAARWVYQAWQLGCHRLGHALALGVAPELFLDQQVQEPRS